MTITVFISGAAEEELLRQANGDPDRAAEIAGMAGAMHWTLTTLRGALDAHRHWKPTMPAALIADIDKLLGAKPHMDAPPPDLTDWPAVAAGLNSALDGLVEQVGQMRGMFNDADGAIQRALDDADEASTAFQAADKPLPANAEFCVGAKRTDDGKIAVELAERHTGKEWRWPPIPAHDAEGLLITVGSVLETNSEGGDHA